MVPVLDKNGQPLMPCGEKRARLLMDRGRAKPVKTVPFAIQLNDRLVEDSVLQPLHLKYDPGSKTTGVALVRDIEPGEPGEGPAQAVIGLFELVHRGAQISKQLGQRSNFRRRRRSKNLRYRKPRFLNRRNRKKGWLAPSIKHRVDQMINFAAKIAKFAPLAGLAMELARFDTQRLQNSEIRGVEYQRGELAGYEVKEYLLEKWGRRCAYRGAEGVPLQVEHVVPKSKGGSGQVSNLALACRKCNERKGSKDLRVFLAKKPDLADRILAKAKAPLRDAAAVNGARWSLWRRLKNLGLPLTAGTGARTKFNRGRFGVPKTHALDAACVGPMSRLEGWENKATLVVKSRGRGSYRRTRVTAHGFPRGYLTRSKSVHGFQTGDLVKAAVPKGKFAGTHTGRVAVRASGSFDIQAKDGKKTVNHKCCRLLQKNDGYEYSLEKRQLEPHSSPG